MNEKQPKPIEGVMDIEAYQVGKASVENKNVKEIVKLSSNETPLGTPDSARKAYMEVAQNLHEYPSGDAGILREAIAKVEGLNATQIVCGCGSDELLAMLAKAYLTKGDEAIYSQYGFLMYRIDILASGATPIVADEVDYTANVDNIISCLSEKTKMVFLANPNNPTGTYLPDSEVRRLHNALPDNVMLVIDSAYAEYMQQTDYDNGAKLVEEANNVVMTRTFSKIYGLASLRVGWAYAPKHIVDVMHRTRGPFNVNAAAINAAKAAVEDTNHIKKAREHNEKWREWITSELTKMGLEVIPSFGNFVTIQFPDELTKNAENADAYLLKNGYILRYLKSYGFPNALRMTIGTQNANEGVVKLLEEYLNG